MRRAIRNSAAVLLSMSCLLAAGCDLKFSLPIVLSRVPFGTVPTAAETRAFVGEWDSTVEAEAAAPQTWRFAYVEPGELRLTIQEPQSPQVDTGDSGIVMVRRLGDVWLLFLKADPENEVKTHPQEFALLGGEFKDADTLQTWLFEPRVFRPAILSGDVLGELTPDSDDENSPLFLTDTPENLMRVFNEDLLGEADKPEDASVLKRRPLRVEESPNR